MADYYNDFPIGNAVKQNVVKAKGRNIQPRHICDEIHAWGRVLYNKNAGEKNGTEYIQICHEKKDDTWIQIKKIMREYIDKMVIKG